MAPPTRRTFSNVKSSAMMPRHPSVPNLIVFLRSSLVMSLQSSSVAGDSSHQLVQLLFVQVLHHFADILRLRPCRNQECVFSFDDYQIVHPYNGYEFSRRVDVVAHRIQRKDAFPGYLVVINRTPLGNMVLVQCSPRTQVIPSEIGRQAEDVGRLFPGTRLENRIIHADVLALWIELTKRACKLRRAIGLSDPVQDLRGFWQVLC